MAEFVSQNPVIRLHQRRQQRLIGGVAGDKQQRARITEPLRQLLLQLLMRLAKAGNVAGTAAADAVLPRPCCQASITAGCRLSPR